MNSNTFIGTIHSYSLNHIYQGLPKRISPRSSLSVLSAHVTNHFPDISICMFHGLLKLHMYYLNALTQLFFQFKKKQKNLLTLCSSSQDMVSLYLVVIQISNSGVI